MGCFTCTGASGTEPTDKNTRNKPNKEKPTAAESRPDSEKEKSDPSGKVKQPELKEEVPKDKQVYLDTNELELKDIYKDGKPVGKQAQTFTFDELTAATGNFRSDCFLGEGGFGKVYKGHLEKMNQVVAIKQLDRNGLQGTKEFVVEVAMLSLVDHPNLVKLIGFCAERDQRLLVYEYMPLGSLETHLH
ncbi:hypothetical protein CRG98_023709, partial [Punica granatum]